MLRLSCSNILKCVICLTFIFSNFLSFSQKTFTISGYIQDASSGEKMIAATIYDEISKKGVVSNTYGFYSLTLPSGEVQITASYIGYQNIKHNFILNRDTLLELSLDIGETLKEIEITEKQSERIQDRTQMSQVSIPIEQIKKAPAFLGETDVLKVLQLLPGVQGGTEGQNGLYVRGGSPDQNLILLDGVPVYNVSHIGGFFSVFNGDAIKNVTLTKGGFPARFGGRLSSVIEIDMKEGNMKEFHGEGGIGLIASRLTLEGPILKDKISFMLSGRRTYLDVIAKPFIQAAIKKENQRGTTKIDVGLRAHFYDLNAKINYKINERHRIFLSAYNGLDIFGAKYDEIYNDRKDFNKTDGGLDWGNITSAFRWNWMIKPKLFANTTITYSDYNVDISAKTEIQETRNNKTEVESNLAKYISGIKDWATKVDFDYIVSPVYRIRTGFGSTWHTYTPGAIQVQSKAANYKLDTTLGSLPLKALEPYTYIENELQFGALKANIGMHISAFNVDNQWYSSIQPRIGFNYLLLDKTSLKASFATMRQYINLLSNERIGLPTDLWVPSTDKIKPQDSWQVALGMAKTIAADYEFSVEGFYKKMHNVTSYKDGASFISANADWQSKITQGDGLSYGSEFLLQKKNGKTTGWLGYTLAWNWRKFDDLNNGVKYPFKYDRRHDLELLISHRFSKRVTLSGSWQYGTGNATSLPVASYKGPYGANQINPDFINSPYLEEFELINGKNNFRMPAYHRMDINFEWSKQKRRHMRTWSVGAYNLYSRANPMFLNPGHKTVVKNGVQIQEKVIKQFSLFPIVPHFMYSFKF